MRHPANFQLRGGIAAIALAVALPFNALAAEPTPDPPEPYLIQTIGVGLSVSEVQPPIAEL